jgi:hypothetical protein
MPWRTTILIGTVVLFAGAAGVPAETPRMVLGAHLGGTGYGYEDGTQDSYARGGAEWRLAWRDALDAGGYAGFNALLGLDYLGVPVDDVRDTEYLSAELALPLGVNRIILDAEALSSFNSPGSVEAYVEPSWGVTYRVTRGRREAEPYLGYRGSHRYERGGPGDRTTHRGVLGVEYNPSIRLGTETELSGGYQVWPEYGMLDADGTTSDERRRDYLAEATLALDGLLGYFVDWRLSTTGRYRDSNANRFLSSSGDVEENAADRFGIDADAGIRWTPTRETGVSLGSGVSTDFYTERSALSGDGAPTDRPLRVTTVSGDFGVDWTPDDCLFLSVSSGVERTLSNEDALEQWTATGELGIEFVLQ